MVIDERTVALTADDDIVKPSEIGWFAARQPGLLRYLEDRMHGDQDALALAVDVCWRVVAAFERKRGLPLPRLHTAELERSEEEVVTESHGELVLARGCAHRQPELCRWLEAMMASPALPLDSLSLDRVALVAAATISACDRAHVPHQLDPTSERSAGVLLD